MDSATIEKLGKLCRTAIDFPLSEKSSFKTGGCAAAALFPDSESGLAEAVLFCERSEVKYAVLGNMTNVLAPDEGYDGAVIFTSSICDVTSEGNTITAECGTSLTAIAKLACSRSLGGFEFAYGIPGTLGGAVFMNAGAFGGCMSDVISKVRTYSPREKRFKEYQNSDCGFGYRESIFRENGEIIISASLSLPHGDTETIKAKMDENMRRRREKQPLDKPSAGSVFKRPEGHFAGALIEAAGLKGLKIGGAQVSEKHAGFIINAGGASSRDVCGLISAVKQKVFENSGVMLREEIVYLK